MVSATASLQGVLSQQGHQEGHHSRDSGGAKRESKDDPDPGLKIPLVGK